MKNKFILGLAVLLILTACGSKNEANSSTSSVNSSTSEIITESAKIVAPTGAPVIAIANYAINHQNDIDIGNDAASLSAAFTNKTADIIIAPINLGAKMFKDSASNAYGLYKVLVWDNLYLVSRNEIKSIDDLKGKEITSFGKGSTPQIVLESCMKANNISTENITYKNNVNEANAAFSANLADIIVSAQPNVSGLDTNGCYVLSLSTFWKETTGHDTYPQSGLFVKFDSYNDIKNSLDEISDSYKHLLDDVETTAKNASELLSGLNENLIKKALPNCGYKNVKNVRESVNNYYQKIIDLGLGASVGGALPNEKFYELLEK